MANLMLEMGSWMTTTGLWGKLIGIFYKALPSMGWTIVIFTICLKLVLIPLDVFQRHISTKTTEKQKEMEPDLKRVQEIYGKNQELLNQKTMEVYKKHNFNMGSSCLGLLINLVITFVVFITLFNSLRSISNIMITEEYKTLRATYIATYNSDYTSYSNENYTILVGEYETLENSEYTSADEYAKAKIDIHATETAQKEVYNKFQDIKEGWLWIKNIYLTDTAVLPYPTFEKYLSNSGEKFKEGYVTLDNELKGVEEKETDVQKAKELAKTDYNKINSYIFEKYEGKWNGYYILIVLAGVITWLSSKVTRIGQPKQTRQVTLADGTVVDKEVDPMGMMTWLLPLLMVFFTWNYTGMFAIYIVVNSAISVIISLSIFAIKKYIITPKKELAEQNAVVTDGNYRINKYTVIDEKQKREKKIFKSKNKDGD